MILIAIDKGNEDFLVKQNDGDKVFSWNEENDVSYYVQSSDILGYIDLTDLSYPFTANPNCYAYELDDILPYSY